MKKTLKQHFRNLAISSIFLLAYLVSQHRTAFTVALSMLIGYVFFDAQTNGDLALIGLGSLVLEVMRLNKPS